MIDIVYRYLMIYKRTFYRKVNVKFKKESCKNKG